jgi:hypothetical protein
MYSSNSRTYFRCAQRNLQPPQVEASSGSYPQCSTLKRKPNENRQFYGVLVYRTRSKETLRAYRQILTRFQAFLKEKGLRETQVKRSTITEYLQQLEAGKGRTASSTLAPSTIALHLTPGQTAGSDRLRVG